MGMRDRIVEEARSWIGTPYHHMADRKGEGVDCGMLLIRVYASLGLCDDFDPRPYTFDWMLHRSEELFRDRLLARSKIVEQPQPGDIILFRVGRCYSHGSIVTSVEPLKVVHAVLRYGRVVEEEVRTNPKLRAGIPSAMFASAV